MSFVLLEFDDESRTWRATWRPLRITVSEEAMNRVVEAWLRKQGIEHPTEEQREAALLYCRRASDWNWRRGEGVSIQLMIPE